MGFRRGSLTHLLSHFKSIPSDMPLSVLIEKQKKKLRGKWEREHRLIEVSHTGVGELRIAPDCETLSQLLLTMSKEVS